jgi:hypothetical protein
MPKRRLAPTPEEEIQILNFIKAGGYPLVAAEAAGVPAALFQKWLDHGRRRAAPARLRTFAEEVSRSVALARLRAELAAYEKAPALWLTRGPGRERPSYPGWSLAVPAAAGASLATGGQTEVFDLLGKLSRVLAPFPEAHAAVLRAVGDHTEEDGGRKGTKLDFPEEAS